MAEKTWIKPARRLAALPPYLFAEIDRLKQEALRSGKDLIDLGVGDPDLPTPEPIVEALRSAARNPRHHRYPSYEGMEAFREAVAAWYRRRFGVKLDPAREVLTLIGSKEGIGHLPLALLNPGDTALIPDPGYPVYQAGTLFAGGRPVRMRLRRENGFLPELAKIPAATARRARVMFLNYPNNPTAATAEPAFFEEAVRFARRHRIAVCHDAAYSEIAFDGYRAPSFLQTDGAIEVGVEFHSLSKTFNMTGWRIGFVVGNAAAIAALGRLKSNLDSGVFQAVQEAGIAALAMDGGVVEKACAVYRERRDALVRGLQAAGLEVTPPRATFYVWARIPKKYRSAQFAALLLSRAGIVATPGNGFGPGGEGYVRFTLTVPVERMREAVARLGSAL